MGDFLGPAGERIDIEAPGIVLAPYVWKRVGMDSSRAVEAAMPGAYVRIMFRGSASVRLIVDTTPNADCPAASLPVISYSVDHRPYQVTQLSIRPATDSVLLAQGLDAGTSHTVEVFFRAADLVQKRWRAGTAHLRLAGFALDRGAELLQAPERPLRAIGYGDSITEGVGVDALFTRWDEPGPNNAGCTWLSEVCLALGAEYGQLGSGGQGMLQKVELPPLPQTWDKYDAATSRLTHGQLLPEPDFVFCLMGTNDRNLEASGYLGPLFQSDMPDISEAYQGWLAAVRGACPRAHIFCIVPPLGFHSSEIQAAVQAQRRRGDLRVHLIDTAPLKDDFGFGPSRLAYDGVHPHALGQARLASLILVQVLSTITREAPGA